MEKFIVAALLLIAAPAFAQNVQYVSPVTRNHTVLWNTNGVIADGGSAADSPITSMGVTNNGGAGFCVSSDRQTALGRNQLCFGASTTGPAVISLQNYGTAAAQNLEFVINGTPVTIPTGGAAFALENPPFVTGHASCFVSSAGVIQDCGVSVVPGTQFGLPYYATASTQASTGAGAAGQFLLGQGASAPLWTSLSGDATSVSAGGALTLGKVNGIPFSSAYAANGVLIGEGTNVFHSVSTLNIGQCLLSQGASDPTWASCASGSGSAGGSNTQVQFNNATALAGSTDLTWVAPALTIGLAGSVTGQLALAPAVSNTGTVTIQNPSTVSAYNFNLPTAAGSAGQPLLSGGGGSTAMSFGTLGVGGGGTNCVTASGTCLDNITGFASTGFVQRTGSGSYTFSLVVPVSGGGTGLANGTSGGILGFTGASTIASSSLLAANGILIGGGAGATPSSITACTNGQMPIGVTSGSPACQTLNGDIASVSSAGATVIANSAITVAKQANAAAWTLEGNFTSGAAAPQFSAIGALTQKSSPASNDLIMIQDQAASGALKFATVSSVASAGSVASVGGLIGTIGLTGPLSTSSNNIILGGTTTAHGLAVWEGTSALGNTGTGSVGQFAGSNGASVDPSFVPGPWTLVATLTISNQGSVTYSSFSSAYTDYKLVFENVLPASTAQGGQLFIQSNGGTGGTYTGQCATVGGTVIITTATTFIPLTRAADVVNSGAGLGGEVLLLNVNQTTAPKNVIATMNNISAQNTGVAAPSWCGGARTDVNTILTGFLFQFASGNAASGGIKVYARL